MNIQDIRQGRTNTAMRLRDIRQGRQIDAQHVIDELRRFVITGLTNTAENRETIRQYLKVQEAGREDLLDLIEAGSITVFRAYKTAIADTKKSRNRKRFPRKRNPLRRMRSPRSLPRKRRSPLPRERSPRRKPSDSDGPSRGRRLNLFQIFPVQR